jgi:ABC-type polysaccharide/polyol phosphate export permease
MSVSQEPIVTGIVPVDAPLHRQFRAAVDDVRASWNDRQMWFLTALRSVGVRYKRTILGPWWLTVQTLIFVFGLSFLRIGLTGTDLREAIPYVGLGFIGFGLISGGVLAGVSVFVGAGTAMSTSRQAYTSYVLKSNTVQAIEFLHDAVAILAIALVFAIPFTLWWGLSALVSILIVISSVGVGLWLGPLVARFRDVGPIVSTVMRLMFFLTPIFWSVDQMSASDRSWMTWWNPFTYQLLAFRDPILGTPHGMAPYVVTVALAVINPIVGFLVFTRVRARLPYWVS